MQKKGSPIRFLYPQHMAERYMLCTNVSAELFWDPMRLQSERSGDRSTGTTGLHSSGRTPHSQQLHSKQQKLPLVPVFLRFPGKSQGRRNVQWTTNFRLGKRDKSVGTSQTGRWHQWQTVMTPPFIPSQTFLPAKSMRSGLNIQLLHALMSLLQSKLGLNFNQRGELSTEPSQRRCCFPKLAAVWQCSRINIWGMDIPFTQE